MGLGLERWFRLDGIGRNRIWLSRISLHPCYLNIEFLDNPLSVQDRARVQPGTLLRSKHPEEDSGFMTDRDLSP